MDVLIFGAYEPCGRRFQRDQSCLKRFWRALWLTAQRPYAHGSLAAIGCLLAQPASANMAPAIAPRTFCLRAPAPTITPTPSNPQLQFTASFAPAATPCELHPTSAHPPHSTSHHRECCPPVRLTVCIPERMVHA